MFGERSCGIRLVSVVEYVVEIIGEGNYEDVKEDEDVVGFGEN